MLQIKDWETWQNYRKDRGAPPWIKLHIKLLSNPQWCALSDSEKGVLVSIWMIGASNNGLVSESPATLRKMCLLDRKPNINKYIELGFLVSTNCHPPANQESNGSPQNDAPEVETEVYKQEVYKQEVETESMSVNFIFKSNGWDLNLAIEWSGWFGLEFGEVLPDWQIDDWGQTIKDMRIKDKRIKETIVEKWDICKQGWWKENGVRITPKLVREKWLSISEVKPVDYEKRLKEMGAK